MSNNDCKVIFIDWFNPIKGDRNISLFDKVILHEYDIAFFDPYRFALNFGFKNDIDQYEAMDYQERFFSQVQVPFQEVTERLVQFFKANGILVIRSNFPNFEIRSIRPGSNYGISDKLVETKSLFFWLNSFYVHNNNQYKKGHSIKFLDPKHPIAKTFKDVKIEYHLTLNESKDNSNKIIATNNTKHKEVILKSFQSKSGNDLVYLIPNFQDKNENEKLKTIFTVIHQNNGCLKESPKWLNSYLIDIDKISNANTEISSLEQNVKELNVQIETNHDVISSLSEYGKLLTEQGKFGLEPIVRKSFRDIGFNCPEESDDEKFITDYDFHIKNDTQIIAVGEIEGKNSAIDLKKFRQLLDRTNLDTIPSDAKGILVGNAFRDKTPTEREEWFTKAVIERNTKQEFCLMPTYELYKIVCFILNNKPSDIIKEEIQQSILNCDTVYEFDEKHFSEKVKKCIR